MDLGKQIRAFTSQYKTSGWLMVIMAGSLVLQGLLYFLLKAIGGNTLYRDVIYKLMLPGSGETFIYQPWSVVTYPFFLHPQLFSLMSLLFSFMLIWMFGRIHQQMLGDQRTRRLIIFSVPVVGIFTVLLASLLTMSRPAPPASLGFDAKPGQEQVLAEKNDSSSPADASSPEKQADEVAVGDTPPEEASTGLRPFAPYAYGFTFIMIVLAASVISKVPDYPVDLMLLGRVRILWVGIAVISLHFLWALINPAMAAGIALAAGLGFLHIYLMKQGVDLTESVWSYYQDKDVKPKMKVKYGAQRPVPAQRQNQHIRTTSELSQEIIDGILDKISAQGYESLSREEKELLFRASTQKGDEKKD